MDPLVARVIKEFVLERGGESGKLPAYRRAQLRRQWPELYTALDNLSWDHTEVSVDAYVVMDSPVSAGSRNSIPAS